MICHSKTRIPASSRAVETALEKKVLTNDFPILGFPAIDSIDFSLSPLSAPGNGSIASFSNQSYVSASHALHLALQPSKKDSQQSSFITQEEIASFPATAALESAAKNISMPPLQHLKSTEKREKMISAKSLKRSRSAIGSFDIGDLLDATKPVEESLAFPSIQWDFDDDHQEDDKDGDNRKPLVGSSKKQREDFDSIFLPRAKRRCRGLVRSKRAESNLADLLIEAGAGWT